MNESSDRVMMGLLADLMEARGDAAQTRAAMHKQDLVTPEDVTLEDAAAQIHASMEWGVADGEAHGYKMAARTIRDVLARMGGKA